MLYRLFLYNIEGVILQDSLNTKSSARNRNRDQQYRFLPEIAPAIMEHWASGIFVVGENHCIYQEEVLGRSDSPLSWSDNLERQVSLIKYSIKEYLMREFRLGTP